MALFKGVNLLPSTGEFSYDTIAHRGQRAVETNRPVVNVFFTPGGVKTDYSYAIDQLQAQHPECTTVSLVIAWFGNSLDASLCKIYPSTTYIGGAFDKWTGSVWATDNWQCSSLTQFSAGLIPISSSGGTFNYGGTPSDQSIVRCIQDLKSRGFRVVFYPFILMDTTGFPWRGQITFSPDKSTAAVTAVSTFLGAAIPANFTRDSVNLTVSYSGSPTDFTYRRMLLHYANLCIVAGGIDLFVIGSELRGLETIRGPDWFKMGAIGDYGLVSAAVTDTLYYDLVSVAVNDSADWGLVSSSYVTGLDPKLAWDYPFVRGLRTLAADVRGIFDGAGFTKNLSTLKNLVSYAADWSMWMGFQHPSENGQWPHLDELYGDSNIDLAGVDNYMPLSDWTTGEGGLDVVHWTDPKPVTWPPAPAAMHGLGLSGIPAILRKDYLKANIEGGEKFNWFYNNSNNLGMGTDPNGSGVLISLPEGDRLIQSRNQFFSGQELLANKQLRWWWNNVHQAIYDTGTGFIRQGAKTQWVAQSKSITFTEYGFASVDRAPNQPNVFFSASAAGSQTPFWSKWMPTGGPRQAPVASDAMQDLGLAAVYEYWFVDGNNITSPRNMIEPVFCSAWNWDARPFPSFPGVSAAWGDWVNWRVGFWINGKQTFTPALGPVVTIAYPLTWPFGVVPARIELSVASMSKSGGQSLFGGEQIVASPAARWEGKLLLPSMNKSMLLDWRGFIAALQGRLGTFNMPIFDCGRQPFGLGAVITVTAAAAAINATTLTLTVTAGGGLLAGHRFSISGRLYEIMRSVAAGGGVYTVDIHPSLRAALGAATPCQFANPTSLMRLATDAEGVLDLESGIIAHPRIDVVEAF